MVAIRFAECQPWLQQAHVLLELPDLLAKSPCDLEIQGATRFELEEVAAAFETRHLAEAEEAYACSSKLVLLTRARAAQEHPVAEVRISDGCLVVEVVEWVVSSEASGKVMSIIR